MTAPAVAHAVGAEALQFYAREFLRGLEPDPDLSVSDWADKYRTMSLRYTPEPGQWRTSRVPYMREPMDMLSPRSPVSRVVIMAGAQVGKSESANNWIGHTIHISPAPMLLVQPSLDLARKYSKQRIAPMIEDCAVLSERVRESKAKDSGNTLLTKEFDNGILVMAGANSPSGLRSMPAGRLALDEIDGYKGDIGGEGDPVAIAEKRTSNFPRRKILLTSTPTVRGISRIEMEYKKTDQRRYFIPCPSCGHMDYLLFRIGGQSGKEGVHHHIYWEGHDPTSAVMVCSACDEKIDEGHKTAMLAGGEWRPTAVGRPGRVGYHLSSLYSPLGWKSWALCVEEFLDAKNDPFALRTWVNQVLGETYEDRTHAIDAADLEGRREVYEGDVPHGVGVLVCSVDVQADRLEVVVKGYGAGEESWLIAYAVFEGDPGTEQPWRELTDFRRQTFKHASGRGVRIRATGIDSGGLNTEEVYRYARLHKAERVYPLKGSSVRGSPLVSRPRKSRGRSRVFMVGTDTAKDQIFSRLMVGPPPGGGPRALRMHFPDWIEREYFEGLTAEKRIPEYVKGRGVVYSYRKKRERNEPLDLEVYALAVLNIQPRGFIASLERRARVWSRPKPKTDRVEDGEPTPPPARRRPVRVRPKRRRGWP